MGDKKRIAVIFGGQSSEHEVSRVSAESVVRNIDRDKFDVVMLGITKDGRWLSYDGPAELLGTGEWERLAEAEMAAGRLEMAGIPQRRSFWLSIARPGGYCARRGRKRVTAR